MNILCFCMNYSSNAVLSVQQLALTFLECESLSSPIHNSSGLTQMSSLEASTLTGQVFKAVPLPLNEIVK